MTSLLLPEMQNSSSMAPLSLCLLKWSSAFAACKVQSEVLQMILQMVGGGISISLLVHDL
jgi:hypothetical protein